MKNSWIIICIKCCFRAAHLSDMSLQKKERRLKRQEKKDKLLAFTNTFQTRSLRERRPVSYNYCKGLLYWSFPSTQKAIEHSSLIWSLLPGQESLGCELSPWWLCWMSCGNSIPHFFCQNLWHSINASKLMCFYYL